MPIQKNLEKFINILFSTIMPYLLSLITIAYLAGIIFVITQNVLPYLSGERSIIVIHPSLSQQTILEMTLVYITLFFLFVSLLALYIIGNRKYHSRPPTILLAFSLFLLLTLFFILWVMLIPKLG